MIVSNIVEEKMSEHLSYRFAAGCRRTRPSRISFWRAMDGPHSVWRERRRATAVTLEISYAGHKQLPGVTTTSEVNPDRVAVVAGTFVGAFRQHPAGGERYHLRRCEGSRRFHRNVGRFGLIRTATPIVLHLGDIVVLARDPGGWYVRRQSPHRGTTPHGSAIRHSRREPLRPTHGVGAPVHG